MTLGDGSQGWMDTNGYIVDAMTNDNRDCCENVELSHIHLTGVDAKECRNEQEMRRRTSRQEIPMNEKKALKNCDNNGTNNGIIVLHNTTIENT